MNKVYTVGKIRFTFTELMIVLAIALIILSKVGFADHKTAKEVLSTNGFSMIETYRGSLLSCGTSMDTFRTGFKAVDRRGVRVEGTICSGLVSDPYIRVKTYIVNL